MARPVFLGNGQLTVGLDEFGLVHDFYYPYVGLENLSTAREIGHKIGVWVDSKFAWVDESWESKVDFNSDALISDISLMNKELQIELCLQDFVDSQKNIFFRKIKVINHADKPRSVRLFMHQMFEISRQGRADTAFFVPEDNYILDYKGKYNLLIYGQKSDGKPFENFAIGSCNIEGKQGTYKDAEDGVLSNNLVEHGSVDSVIGFSLTLNAKGSDFVEYWIIAADTQYNAERIHHNILQDTFLKHLDRTRESWHEWFNQVEPRLNKIDLKYIDTVKKSLMLIKVHIDKRGGIIASCDSSIYNYGRDYYSYVWPRDGAYAIWPLIRMGFVDEPKMFFEFCRDIVSNDGYMMHKYQPDKSIGSTWHPLLHDNRKELAIQEDETAIIIFMLGQYYLYTNDDDFIFKMYDTFIKPAANFLATYIDEKTNLPHASYDLWEEKFLTSTYTVAVVYQALMTATQFAEKFDYPDDALNWKSVASKIANNVGTFFNNESGYLVKGYLLDKSGELNFDNILDVSSFYGAFMFGQNIFKLDQLHSTITKIENILIKETPIGLSPRYENDKYFASTPIHKGNPWIVTSLWIAQYYLSLNMVEEAKTIIEKCLSYSLHSGVLSEQVNPESGKPVSVTPLVWSHSELINTILDLSLNTHD